MDAKTKILRTANNNPDNSRARLITKILNESGKSFIIYTRENI